MDKYTKEILIKQVQQLTEELGRPPKRLDFERCRETASSATAEKYFGTWNAFLTAAGVKKDATYRQKRTNQELIEQVQRLATELGRTPHTQEFEKCKYTARMTVVRQRFGDWKTFVESAGLRANRMGRVARITADELIRQVQQLAEDLGRAPSAVQFNACEHTSSANAAKSRFGSWSAFLVAAGLTPDSRGRKRKAKEDDADGAEN